MLRLLRWDLNPRHRVLQTRALPSELRSNVKTDMITVIVDLYFYRLVRGQSHDPFYRFATDNLSPFDPSQLLSV